MPAQQDVTDIERALANRDYQLAISISNELLHENPSQADLLRIRGVAFQGMQDYQQALASFSDALKTDSLNISLKYYIAECLEQLGDSRSAISILAETHSMDSTALYPVQNLARLLAREKRFEEAIPFCVELVERYPANFNYRKNLATCSYQLDNIGWALVHFREAWYLNKRDLSIPVSIANVYVKFKEPLSAIEILKEGLAVDSSNINILKTLGYLYFMGEEYSLAGENFQKALTAGDSTTFVFKHLGISLYNQNKYQSAIPVLENYYRADTLNSEATYWLGMAMANWHRKTEGIEYLKKTLELSTPDPVFMGSIWATIGTTHGDMNMNLSAISDFSAALGFDPGRASYIFEMAKMHDMIGKRDSDIPHYKKAIELYEKYLAIEEPRLKIIMEARNLEMDQIDAPGINYARDRIRIIREELFFLGETGNEG